MVFVQILFLCVLILGIAWKMKVSFVEAVPIGTSLLVLLLYGLAFFDQLSLSDHIAVLTLGTVIFLVAKCSAQKRKEIMGFVKKELLSPPTVTALVMTVAVTVCVAGKVTSWWDDYNFWATDVKSLFYLDGFAGKYTNVAAEFGDYPPGTQLMKWWFLHFSPNEFREGLMFAGYYFMNLSFLFPFLGYIKKEKPLLVFAGGIVLWLFPAVAEVFWIDGCCADLTMAVVYGAFLVSVFDGKEKGRIFYYGRQALFLMILMLCKNTGFLWVAFGLIFDYGYHIIVSREEKKSLGLEKASERKKDKKALLLVTVLPVLTELSWLIFCLWNRRVAKLTGTAIKMAIGNMNLPEYQEAMTDAFLEAFVSWPLHRGKTLAIDLSPLGLYLLLLVFVLLLGKFQLLGRRKTTYLLCFFAISGGVFYTFNLISHLTIFAIETQYLEPFGMVSSIERYGAPFTIGGLYLLGYLVLHSRQSVKAVLACMLFVLLTTDYGGAYRAIWGYRTGCEEILSQRNEMIDENAEKFLSVIDRDGKERIGRVLYLRDVSNASWVRNTYVGFEAAPVSVMYGSVDADQMDTLHICQAIEESHAGYLYVDELKGKGSALFTPLVEEEFVYGCLYRVAETPEGIKLQKCEMYEN